MNVSSVPAAVAIEKFKSEILQFQISHPQETARQGNMDSVSITDLARVLSDLAKAGSADSAALLAGILAGRREDSLEFFLQAYCAVYGIDLSGQAIIYNKYGRRNRGSNYDALKRYLSTLRDYLLQEAAEEDKAVGFFKTINQYLKRLAKYFTS